MSHTIPGSSIYYHYCSNQVGYTHLTLLWSAFITIIQIKAGV